MSRTIRRIAIAGALLLLASVGVAVAQETTRCDTSKCVGTPQNDTLVASDGENTVLAKGGDDDVELDETIAVGSDDIGRGGRGQDCIDGGAGADLMIGGPGDDNRPCEFTAFVNPRAALTAGPGDDIVLGRKGDDSLDGITGSDKLVGGAGDDVIDDPAPSDSDRLLGRRGNDELTSTDADGDDLVDGGRGTDSCTGDSGDVFVRCETVTPVPAG